MHYDAKDTPTCDLSGLERPHPRLTATPLSIFFSSSPEASPIVPETQVSVLEIVSLK